MILFVQGQRYHYQELLVVISQRGRFALKYIKMFGSKSYPKSMDAWTFTIYNMKNSHPIHTSNSFFQTLPCQYYRQVIHRHLKRQTGDKAL